MSLPSMRIIRHARAAHDLTVLFVFADQVATRLGRERDHLIAVGLQANDFTKVVTIHHQDGSKLVFRHAFTVTATEHQAVFTEHHGYHVFHREDVVLVSEEPIGPR